MSLSKPETLKFKRKTVRARLNKRTLETLAIPQEIDGRPAQAWTYDTEAARLAICVWSTGAKTWYWVGRVDGRMARIKLGEFPEITPDNARKLASKNSLLVAEGHDPRKAKRDLKDAITLDAAFNRWLDDYGRERKKTWKADEQLYDRYLARWKARRLADITHADVVTLHNKIGRENGRYAANRMLSLLSTIFTFFGTGKFSIVTNNPCRGVERFDEEERERILSGPELERFFKALDKETDLMRDYFIVALLTGGRRGNVQSMTWTELDLDAGIWRIPGEKFKNGKPQNVHLHADAVAILRRRKESSKSEYVFPGRSGGHLEFIYKAWARICKRAELEGVRPHDLRRTLGSWQAGTGASLPIIGKTLGHLDASTTSIYARLNIDPVRKAVNTAVDAMMGAAKGGKE